MIVIPLSEFGLMTVQEVADYHDVTMQTIWRWVAEERFPAVPIARGILIRRVDCEKFKKPTIGRPSGRAWAGEQKPHQ